VDAPAGLAPEGEVEGVQDEDVVCSVWGIVPPVRPDAPLGGVDALAGQSGTEALDGGVVYGDVAGGFEDGACGLQDAEHGGSGGRWWLPGSAPGVGLRRRSGGRRRGWFAGRLGAAR